MIEPKENSLDSLRNIQQKLKAPKNQLNKFGGYKYRNLEDILEAVKPILEEEKAVLTIEDEVLELNGNLALKATAKLMTPDSFFCVSAIAGIDPSRKGMDIAQSYGTSSSYARKCALNGLFAIDDTKDPDSTNTHGKGSQASNTGIKSEFLKLADGNTNNGVKDMVKNIDNYSESAIKKAIEKLKA
jgi:hypothetical protein